MKEKKHLYFIALIPAPDIIEMVTVVKYDFANRFQSRHALKVVPHITLKSPFSLPVSSHEFLIQWFSELPVTVNAFRQELNGFGSFSGNRSPVIYIKPVINNALTVLQKEVISHFRKAFPAFEAVNAELNYRPHMTVAYRDLSPPAFEEAWKEYADKNFSAAFEVKNLCLLQHINKKWECICERALPA